MSLTGECGSEVKVGRTETSEEEIGERGAENGRAWRCKQSGESSFGSLEERIRGLTEK